MARAMKKRSKKKARADKPKYPELDRMVFDVIHELAGIAATELAEKSFLSASTISKIRRGPANGGTRYPRGITLQELARLAGGEIRFHARINQPQEERKLITFVPRSKRYNGAA